MAKSTLQNAMGTAPIDRLLFQQALPAAIGILMLSINGVVDAIFVGNWIGSMAIGAIQVVTSISFLISSLGMAIGVGGASIISRAFGKNDIEKVRTTFGNQSFLNIGLAIIVVFASTFFYVPIIKIFGGKGDLLQPSIEYFLGILPGIPFLAWAMMSNNVLRAEGAPKIAMITMIIPAFVNLALDPIFILYLDLGMKGAAWATCVSYIASGVFTLMYFIFGNSNMSFNMKYLKPNVEIMSEIVSLAMVTFSRQGVVGLLAVVLNNVLFAYGAELAVSAYGIVSRMLMFSFFPVFGVTQGFLPIAGFNLGAEKYERVREVTYSAIKYGSLIAFGVFIGIELFAENIIRLFTKDPELIFMTLPALRWVFAAVPFLTIQLIGSAYYQAEGRAIPALFLSIQKHLLYLVPLVLILPKYFGIYGIWYAFPIADILTAAVCGFAIWKSLKKCDREIEKRNLK